MPDRVQIIPSRLEGFLTEYRNSGLRDSITFEQYLANEHPSILLEYIDTFCPMNDPRLDARCWSQDKAEYQAAMERLSLLECLPPFNYWMADTYPSTFTSVLASLDGQYNINRSYITESEGRSREVYGIAPTFIAHDDWLSDAKAYLNAAGMFKNGKNTDLVEFANCAWEKPSREEQQRFILAITKKQPKRKKLKLNYTTIDLMKKRKGVRLHDSLDPKEGYTLKDPMRKYDDIIAEIERLIKANISSPIKKQYTRMKTQRNLMRFLALASRTKRRRLLFNRGLKKGSFTLRGIATRLVDYPDNYKKVSLVMSEIDDRLQSFMGSAHDGSHNKGYKENYKMRLYNDSQRNFKIQEIKRIFNSYHEACSIDKLRAKEFIKQAISHPSPCDYLMTNDYPKVNAVSVELETLLPCEQSYDEENDEYQNDPIDAKEIVEGLPAAFGDDGSLENDFDDPHDGVEFKLSFYTSDPSPLIELCKRLRNARAQVNRSCGFHVHFPMPSREEMRRCANNISRYEPLMFALVADSRRNNTYCQRGLEEGDRYHAINMDAWKKHNTLEIRLHHGTTDPKKILAWIELCRFLMTCTKGFSFEEDDGVATAEEVCYLLNNPSSPLSALPKSLREFLGERYISISGNGSSYRRYLEAGAKNPNGENETESYDVLKLEPIPFEALEAVASGDDRARRYYAYEDSD